MEVCVLSGGQITATFHAPEGVSPPVTLARLTRLLQASHSIPLTWELVVTAALGGTDAFQRDTLHKRKRSVDDDGEQPSIKGKFEVP